MTRKRRNGQGNGTNGCDNGIQAQPNGKAMPSLQQAPGSTPGAMSHTSSDSRTGNQNGTLMISRNKHWRYISSYHGPWLNLPIEVLESLAHTNYLSPRPHPIDPAIFFDLVKIRRAVDDATDIAVRASSGLTTAALNNSLNNWSNGAASLGFGHPGSGSSKLSRERKHRMREQASQKLSSAYQLDDIATSVATMQGSTSLDDVAQQVLHRNPTDYDARLVHFFHEKIPSRGMAEYTPLEELNKLIAERSGLGGVWRTRALTRAFKNEWQGAVRDLTEALAGERYRLGQHRARRDQLVLARAVKEEAIKRAMSWSQEARVPGEDQPSSLEGQLLFHRANSYLTIASGSVDKALAGLREFEQKLRKLHEEHERNPQDPWPALEQAELIAQRKRLEARRLVRTNAKRAIKDYLAFLSRFDYTPGLVHRPHRPYVKRVCEFKRDRTAREHVEAPIDGVSLQNGHNSPENTQDALVVRARDTAVSMDGCPNGRTPIPTLTVYEVSQLFSPTPPVDLPLCEDHRSLARKGAYTHSEHTTGAEQQEKVTYHPLLSDALHSLLLAHALAQTSPTELLRHAHNAARIMRLSDGYPVFLAPRSLARAEWTEVLRLSGDWIGLRGSWDALCRPVAAQQAPIRDGAAGAAGERGRVEGSKLKNLHEDKEDARREEIIRRVKAERARRRLAEDEAQRKLDALAIAAVTNVGGEGGSAANAGSMNNGMRTAGTDAVDRTDSASRTAQEDLNDEANGGTGVRVTKSTTAVEEHKAYQPSGSRAEAIARWVRDAPVAVGVKKRKSKVKVEGVVTVAEKDEEKGEVD